jgi:hypothetical protein
VLFEVSTDLDIKLTIPLLIGTSFLVSTGFFACLVFLVNTFLAYEDEFYTFLGAI